VPLDMYKLPCWKETKRLLISDCCWVLSRLLAEFSDPCSGFSRYLVHNGNYDVCFHGVQVTPMIFFSLSQWHVLRIIVSSFFKNKCWFLQVILLSMHVLTY
jgi:hypothetical protein